MKEYGKLIMSVGFAALIALYAALSGDNHVDLDEGFVIATALVNAVLVYIVPVTVSHPWVKTACSVVLALLGAGAVVVAGGLQSNEWVFLILIAGQALGVGAAPAISTTASVGWGSDKDTVRKVGVPA